jgi:phage gp29-like protein
MPLTPNEIARTNLQVAISAWTPGIIPTWTIAQVRRALRAHRDGVFSESAALVDTMGEDDQIPSLEDKRVDAILQSEFKLDPVEAPNRQLSKRIAEQFGPLWWDMFPEAELKDFLRWGDMLGVSVACLDWDRKPSRWNGTLRTLPPHFLRRDDHLGKWFYQSKEGELEVKPGDGRWVLLTEGQRGWMYGLVRRLAMPWVDKNLTIRDWNRYNERHGLPIILAKAPAIADEGDKEQFWEDMENLASEAVAQLPTHLDDNGAAFDLDLLEAKDPSWKSFEARIDRTDRRFTVIFTGGNLSTEVASTGSNRATAEVHEGELPKIATATEKRFSTTLRREAFWPIVALNVAGATFEATPWPKWLTMPPENAAKQAVGQKAFGDAITAVEASGYDIENVAELGEEHGLKLKKREKEPAPPAPVPAPNPPPTPAPPEQRRKRPSPQLVKLASSILAADSQGFIDGQFYADALVDSAVQEGGDLLAEDREDILRVLDEAESYEDLRARLRALYVDMDPDAMTGLVARAIKLAALAGTHAVNEDS